MLLLDCGEPWRITSWRGCQQCSCQESEHSCGFADCGKPPMPPEMPPDWQRCPACGGSAVPPRRSLECAVRAWRRCHASGTAHPRTQRRPGPRPPDYPSDYPTPNRQHRQKTCLRMTRIADRQEGPTDQADKAPAGPQNGPRRMLSQLSTLANATAELRNCGKALQRKAAALGGRGVTADGTAATAEAHFSESRRTCGRNL